MKDFFFWNRHQVLLTIHFLITVYLIGDFFEKVYLIGDSNKTWNIIVGKTTMNKFTDKLFFF